MGQHTRCDMKDKERTIEFSDLTGRKFSVFLGLTSYPNEFDISIRGVDEFDCVQMLLTRDKIKALIKAFESALKNATNIQP